MTFVPQARLVLHDAMFVRNKLENEIGVTEWRVNWVLCVVLLRTVGHVLDKVDGRDDPRVKEVSKGHYRAWLSAPEHEIFRNFIENERNNIVKEYSSSVTEGPIPLVAYLQSNDGFDQVRQFLIEENIYRPLHSGHYEGEDGRTLLDEAIEWWRTQLQRVDEEVEAAVRAAVTK